MVMGMPTLYTAIQRLLRAGSHDFRATACTKVGWAFGLFPFQTLKTVAYGGGPRWSVTQQG